MKEDIWHNLASAAGNRETARLVVVAHSEGSVPGKTGAKMLITPNAVFGTVGGGSVEHQLISDAKRTTIPIVKALVSDGRTSGSICSGCQQFLIIPITASHEETAREIAVHIASGAHGLLSIENGNITFAPDQSMPTSFRHLPDRNRWIFRETIGYRHVLTIIGGGHVALALSRIMATLPFRIRVLDNRPHLPTMQQNTFAHERLIADYADILPLVTEGERAYVAIMTHGHQGDEQILAQLAPLDFAYLGMMGSKTKTRYIIDRLASRGIPKAALERVHAPIGIPIGSKTPPEIALSIAAEIIKVMNG